MKVLVTGATSGLGRKAVEYLRRNGISVRASGRNEAMGKLLEKMGAEFVHADLTELVSSQEDFNYKLKSNSLNINIKNWFRRNFNNFIILLSKNLN